MMPHPERASEAVLGNTDGLALFQSIAGAALATAR
jgi:phosphoribosylformylglycinamidine (FGAM) synthase-like amidotransferase family enzyme